MTEHPFLPDYGDDVPEDDFAEPDDANVDHGGIPPEEEVG